MENGDAPSKNGHKKHKFTKIGPRFGIEKPAIPGPGRPRLSDSVREARQILKDAAPEMVAEIVRLAQSKDEDIRIKAIKVGLDKILPNLEEVDMHDDRPLQQFSDQQLAVKLKELEGNSGDSLRTGEAA